SDSKLTAFRAAVDEHYRYHQFWGGMTLVMPSLYFGLMGQVLRTANHLVFILLLLGFTGIEILTGWAAVVAYRNYVRRARHIMKRSARAERSHHGFE
ncbi:MAG: hypothetical protein ACRD35_03080, partial [Candidatus Acidiferrales bacterium]